jgi:UDP-N-acetyl-2-amino-2-deoxyglucuronate dehydrogenase
VNVLKTDPRPESPVPAPPGLWTVYRIDDNGNTFVVREHLSREETDRVVAEFEARGHKQMYWAEREAG